MRYIIFILLLISITSNSNAQSRINNSSSSLQVEAKSAKLKDATGWKKDIMGNWVSNINAISETQLNEQTRHSVPQNFKWIQIVEFNFNNKTHYALLYESDIYIAGIQKQKRVYFYLMSPASYKNLVTTIQDKTGETLTIHSGTYGYMSDEDGIYSQEKLFNLINRSVLASNTLQLDLVVNAQHVDREDVVRFRLPEQANMIRGLDDNYFESNWHSFNSILLPVSKTPVSDEFELEGGAASGANKTDISNELPDRDTPASEDTFSIDNNAEDTDTFNSDSLETIIDRVSKENAYISDPIATLSNIEGWYKNTNGKWVSDNDPSYNFESVGKYEFHRFVYHGVECLVLARHEKYAGTSYYLIKKEEYDKEIAKLESSSTLNFPIIASLGIGHKLEDIAKKGEEYIDSPKDGEKIIIRDNYITLQQRNSINRNIARFFFFEKNCTQYGENGSVMCNNNVSNKIRYDETEYIGTEAMFDKMYYEVDLTNFIKFLKSPLKMNPIKTKKENNIFDLD